MNQENIPGTVFPKEEKPVNAKKISRKPHGYIGLNSATGDDLRALSIIEMKIFLLLAGEDRAEKGQEVAEAWGVE